MVMANLDPVFRPRRIRAALSALVAAAALALPLAMPGPALGSDSAHLRIGSNSYGRSQPVSVGLNRSLIVDLPAEVREVVVTQPAIAGAIMRSKNRAIVQGVGSGSTNILFLDARGNPITVLDVSVGGDSAGVGAAIARILPGSRIQVESFGDRIVLSGYAASQDDAARAVAIATQFAGSADNVANLITLDGAQQVMLKVAVAEVQRSVAKELGVNLTGSMTVGNVSLGLNTTQPTTFGTPGGSIGGNGTSAGLSLPGFSLDAAIRALQDRNSLRLLAEPVLTAMSGETADFLVGGELPFPVSRDQNGNPIIEWKPFGVELEFTPTVKSNGIIGLKVQTAVSELRADSALNKREVSTTVELGAGQTLAIGGILQETTRQQIAGLPGLSDIPILGTLFRSRQYQSNQTELVVLVTPYLAKAGPAPTLPTDTYVPAGDAEAVFLGHMEKMYGVGPGGMRGSYRGSVGFLLD